MNLNIDHATPAAVAAAAGLMPLSDGESVGWQVGMCTVNFDPYDFTHRYVLRQEAGSLSVSSHTTDKLIYP